MKKFRSLRGRRVLSEALESRLMMSVDVLTHHGNPRNDGANLAETVLTPSNVIPADFGKQYTASLDGGDVIAQPLYMQNVNITTGTSPGVHSVVFIGTEADGLYALDANTGSVLWHDNFTNTTDPTVLTPTTGVTTILQADIANNPDVGAQLGILATPAVDANTGILYLNANTKEIRADGKHFAQRLWAVSIHDGTSVMTPALIGDTLAPSGLTTTGPYTYVAGPIINGTGNNNPAGHPTPVYPDTDGWVAAPGGATGYVLAFNAIEQMERTAVSLINGVVYLGFASHGDDGPYYGWVLGYSATDLSIKAVFNTAPNFEPDTVVSSSTPFWNLGGIWMSGSNISTDGTNLYLVTGNGAFNGQASNFDAGGFPLDHDYGDSVLKLTPDTSTQASQNGNGWGLKVADYFTPSNAFELNDLDLDLGSGGATLLPDSLLSPAGNPMLMVGGKESRIYLIDRNNMGKFNFTYPTGVTSVDPRPYDRVVAEYPNTTLNNGNKQIYSSATYWNGNIYMGVKGTPALEINIQALEDYAARNYTAPAYTPIATTNNFGYPGETFELSANGNTNGVAFAQNPGGSNLLAYNASSFVAPIYDSNTTAGDSLGGSIHFHVPTEANGMVYAGSRGGGLGAYGLKPSYLTSNAAFFSAPSGLTASRVSDTDTQLSWVSNSALATEFRVDRSTNGTSWTTLSFVSGNVSSYDDTTFLSNTRYQYRVVGIKRPELDRGKQRGRVLAPLEPGRAGVLPATRSERDEPGRLDQQHRHRRRVAVGGAVSIFLANDHRYGVERQRDCRLRQRKPAAGFGPDVQRVFGRERAFGDRGRRGRHGHRRRDVGGRVGVVRHVADLVLEHESNHVHRRRGGQRLEPERGSGRRRRGSGVPQPERDRHDQRERRRSGHPGADHGHDAVGNARGVEPCQRRDRGAFRAGKHGQPRGARARIAHPGRVDRELAKPVRSGRQRPDPAQRRPGQDAYAARPGRGR